MTMLGLRAFLAGAKDGKRRLRCERESQIKWHRAVAEHQNHGSYRRAAVLQ